MVSKSISMTACACLAVVAVSASAAITSIDWLVPGDILITRDDVSGLDWLDLTETNGLSYYDISSQLVAGGRFDGWRYATNSEVVLLWNNFGIDLSLGEYSRAHGQDSAVIEAVGYLGNIKPVPSYSTLFSVLGVTADGLASNGLDLIGAGIDISLDRRNPTGYVTAYIPVGGLTVPPGYSFAHAGSYLVKSSTVPVPPAVWLFGTGLVGFIGIARRIKNSSVKDDQARILP